MIGADDFDPKRHLTCVTTLASNFRTISSHITDFSLVPLCLPFLPLFVIHIFLMLQVSNL